MNRDPLDLLDRLDDRVLPVAGRALGRAGGGLTRAGGRLRDAGDVVADRAGRLATRVDDRLGLRDRLGLTGDAPSRRPAIAAASLAAVTVAVLLAVALTRSNGNGRPLGSGEIDPPVTTPSTPLQSIGPPTGIPLDVYLASARERAFAYSATFQDRQTVAVVSFTSYLTPAALNRTLRDYRLTRVFFRMPPTGPLHQAAVVDPVEGVAAAFTEAAKADPALRPSCGCVYGAVVRVAAFQLPILDAVPGVRAVDAAEPGTEDAATAFTAVLPGAR